MSIAVESGAGAHGWRRGGPAITFAAVATSLPMLANRDIDVITAVISSINGVLRNKPAMLVWAFLICTLTGIGFLTAGIGLIFIIPWLAYATWHGYRAALDVSEWAKLWHENEGVRTNEGSE